jgi:hypothetical protein
MIYRRREVASSMPAISSDTTDAIRYRMETGGYTQADLGLPAWLAPAGVGHFDPEAPSHDENGLEAAPRVGHSSGSPDHTHRRERAGRPHSGGAFCRQ